MNFLGVDLGWCGRPSGVALLEGNGAWLRLVGFERLQSAAEILDWIAHTAGNSDAIVGVDAPLVITNNEGARSYNHSAQADRSVGVHARRIANY
jgi:predicted RNase H-like nuclease